MAAAQLQGSRVEVLGERTGSSLLFANPDGSYTVEASPGPVRVQRPDGSWSSIDTTLVAAPDGSSVAPRAAASEVRLSNGQGDPAGPASPVLATVEAPGDSDSLSDAAASVSSSVSAADAPALDEVTGGSVSVSLGWDGALPRPVLAGNQASYPDVAPGQDLRVQVLARGVETFVDLTRPPATAGPVTVSLPVSTKGLTLAEDGHGGLVLKDAAGEVVGHTPRALVWDATVDPRSGDPARQVAVDTELVRAADGSQRLQVSVPQAFWDDPAVRYPVTIDPAGSISASADTYVEKGYDSTSFGTDDVLKVGTYDGGTHVGRSFLLFPMGALTNLASASTVVDSASLHLYETWSSSCTAAAFSVRRLVGSFSESSTWTSETGANDPIDWSMTYGSATEAHGYSSSCPAAWVNASTGVAVSTALVQNWARGTTTNYGIALTASETANSGWKQFASADHPTTSLHPWLSVTFHHLPSTAGTPSTVPAPNAGGWITSLTPTLRAAVSDLDGGNVQGRFKVCAGSTLVWTGLSAAVTSGSVASVTVPAGTLSAGVVYTVRVYSAQAGEDSPTWSPYLQFKADPLAPGVATVASSAYPAGAWSSTAVPSTFTFTHSPGDSDVASYSYWMNTDAPAGVAADGAGDATTAPITPPNGWDTLHVQAVDTAGNVSPAATFTFGVVAGLSAPTPGARTPSVVPLGASGPAAATGVTF